MLEFILQAFVDIDLSPIADDMIPAIVTLTIIGLLVGIIGKMLKDMGQLRTARTMNKKAEITGVTVIWLIVLLVAGGVVYRAYFYEASGTGTETTASASSDSRQPYDFLMYTNGSSYFLQNGTDGSLVDSSINGSALLQEAFDISPRLHFHLHFMSGLYVLNYNVTYYMYSDGSPRMILTGEGHRYARYGTMFTDIRGSMLFFNHSSFNQNYTGTWDEDHYDWIWNEYSASFVCEDMIFVFHGDGAYGGKWTGQTTGVLLNRVSLVVTGDYADNTDILFGRGVGADGTTYVWNNVLLDVQCTGDYLTIIRVNFDTFVWTGGSILDNTGAGTANPRFVRLEATQGATLTSISTYRDSGATSAVVWFYLTPANWQAEYVFNSIGFYEWANQTNTSKHFTSTEGEVWVRLIGCATGIGASGWKISTGGNQIHIAFENAHLQRMVSQSNSTATTCAITHGLNATPNFVWCSFNTTAVDGYTWVATSTTVTVTVTGTLPAYWATYARIEYVNAGA